MPLATSTSIGPSDRRSHAALGSSATDSPNSTAAYQGAGLALEGEIFTCLSRLVIGDLAPDLTLVLDLATEEALARATSRGARRDRYESMNLEFHRRVRAAFLDIARAGGRRYAVIDAAPDVRRVQQAVWDVVQDRLGIS